MQEIQTEATIGMFRDTETIQINPTNKYYRAIENRRAYWMTLQKEIGRWWFHNLTQSCNSSSEWDRRPRMSFFRSPKMWKSQGQRYGLYGECWSVSQSNLISLSLTRLAVWGQGLSCRRMIRPTGFPGRFDIMACSSTLSHQKTKHTSLILFACFHFQCWTNTLNTTLTSGAIKK